MLQEFLGVLRLLGVGVRRRDHRHLLQGGIPALFQGRRDQPIGGIDFFIAPLRELRFIRGPLKLEPPLARARGLPLGEFLLGVERELQLRGTDRL